MALPDAHAGPRRLLSLDGGGIRGVISLGVLERIETLFREHRRDPGLVLADEFSFFAGTSTGAIIAACLSWGMPVSEVISLYREHGRTMFTPARPWQRFRARYRAGAIENMFRTIFVEHDGTIATLRSSRLRALLLIVLRNATTGSAWPLTNNPSAMFNDPRSPKCNLNLPLWQVLRASTAAPTFFPPERITIGTESFTFMDGGITPYNNPALIALLTATLPEYRIQWEPGPDRLSLVSVGTGRTRAKLSSKPIDRLNMVDHMQYVPPALIGSISEQQDMLCRVLGRCRFGEPLDLEIDRLDGPGPLDRSRLCDYLRYNPPLTALARLDDVTRIEEFTDIGRAYAAEAVRPHDLGLGPATE